jgi:hypothetical protein
LLRALIAIVVIVVTSLLVCGRLLAQTPPEGTTKGMAHETPTPDLATAPSTAGEVSQERKLPPRAPPAPTAVTRFYDEEQLKQGGDIFEFRCSTCHGDRGQGLAEWRATWPEEKQNCWQAKCHNPSGLPEGFLFPKYVPAVIGPYSLVRFQTAQELFNYLSARMPYQTPGSLSPQDYWALTAFLLDAHNVPANGQILDSSTATAISLSAKPAPTSKSRLLDWRPIVLSSAVLLLALAGFGVAHKLRHTS